LFFSGILPFALGNINGIIVGIVHSPYSVVGFLLLANVYQSLRLEKPGEDEDNGYTFF
jgi:hypothetical protein